MKLALFLISCLLPFSAHAEGRWFDRVLVIVFENKDGVDVGVDPYFASLAQRGVSFSRYDTLLHPSYPNYLAMTGGETFGVKNNTQKNLDARHLGDLLEEKGLSWKAYAQRYPGKCFLRESQGKYVRKHVPFLSFKNVQQSAGRCARVVEAGEFLRDMDRGTLPELSLYIPDQSNNGHDTDIPTASRWLKSFLEPVLAKLPRRTLVVVTFDESEQERALLPIFTALIGDMVPAGRIETERTNHYGLLRTIEDNFGLGSLDKNDRVAKAFSFWK